jgi:hypothetical protein
LVFVLIYHGGLIASGSPSQIEQPPADFSQADVVVEYQVARRADNRPAVGQLFHVGQVGSRLLATVVGILRTPGPQLDLPRQSDFFSRAVTAHAYFLLGNAEASSAVAYCNIDSWYTRVCHPRWSLPQSPSPAIDPEESRNARRMAILVPGVLPPVSRCKSTSRSGGRVLFSGGVLPKVRGSSLPGLPRVIEFRKATITPKSTD